MLKSKVSITTKLLFYVTINVYFISSKVFCKFSVDVYMVIANEYFAKSTFSTYKDLLSNHSKITVGISLLFSVRKFTLRNLAAYIFYYK